MPLPEILELLVFVTLPIVFIARWRGLGALVSIPVVLAAIYGVLKCFPEDQVWEDLEDWPRFGLPITTMWSVLLYGLSLWFRASKTKKPGAISGAGCDGARGG